VNVPQFARAIEVAAREYDATCQDARERMLKAIAVARQEFLEDDEALQAIVEHDVPVRLR
jgi:hypothetical protein